jgi:ABC-type nitrate/sulfonate/bicarbonate transport system substrate-binding protein
MTRLRIGGVPEHFNLPWHRVLDSGALREAGIEAAWEDYPGGSGAMRDALDEGRLDVAMLLTEAAVAGVAGGAAFHVVSLYTETPLLWGFQVPAASAFGSVEELRGARYAISRFGSGSHLMAFVLAEQRGWPAAELRFVAVGNLAGAVAAFEQGAADVFLWEKFMTKPLIDGGQFRRVGELTAPWPAFVVCASRDAVRERRDAIAFTLRRVFAAARGFAAGDASAGEIAERFGLSAEDAAEWLRITRWAEDIDAGRDALQRTAAMLAEAGVIAADTVPDLVADL